jgi:hypothetical protein
MKIIDIKEVMSETGHASDSCLIWSAEDMRNAIQWKLSPDQDLNLNDAQCKQLLDEFFMDYGDAIVSEIHENMSAWISDKMELDNLGL